MLRNTAMAFAAAASLMLGVASVTPALANYSQCDEQPNADSCPTYAAPRRHAAAGRTYSRHASARMSSQRLGSPFTAAHGMTAY